MSLLDTIFRHVALAYYEPNPQQRTSGEPSHLLTDALGQLLVTTDGTSTDWQDTLPATSERVVKSAPGRLWQLVFHNVGPADAWVFVFSHPTAGVGRPANGGPALFLPVRVNAGQAQGISLPRPRRMPNGIYWAASSTPETFTYDASAELLACAEYG